MTITLTLQSAYTGNTSIGPFTVSGTTNGGSLNDINMTTGSISRTQLTSGWSYNDTNDTITGGTITSVGVGTCSGTVRDWSVIPPCECLSVTNEGSRSEIFQYNRCLDGQLVPLSAPNGQVTTVCVQNGTDIIDTSGFLTSTNCDSPCTVNGDCADCV